MIIIAKKKPKIEKTKEEQPKQQKETITEVDCFLPTHFVDWHFFGGNIDAMLNEIPIRKLYVGCNNPDKKYRDTLEDFLSGRDDRIEFIDQYKLGIKTLGMQIVELMKRMSTPYFVFCHADARPTRHSFMILEADMFTEDPTDDRQVGIIESERVQYEYGRTDFPTVYAHYAFIKRSFSGYQLFRKEAVEHFFDKIEDDYIYRNEDIIWQNICENNGYRYVKTFGLHIHTCSNVNQRWTPQGVELTPKEARAKTFDMQIKGLIKYCTPTELAIDAWTAAIGVCISENGLDLFGEHFDYIQETNSEWLKPIKEKIIELLKYYAWR